MWRNSVTRQNLVIKKKRKKKEVMLRYTHILWAWNTHGTGHCCQGVLNLFHYFNKKNKKIKKYINKTKKQQKKHMKGNCVKWNVIMNMENTGDGPRFANSITCSTNLTELFSSLQKCNISGFYKGSDDFSHKLQLAVYSNAIPN